MDVSNEEPAEIWINEAFGIPSVPKSQREHYPFSRAPALAFRLKLVLVLLHALYVLCNPEQPCYRLALLLNGWLLFVTCELVLKNYPWREPLNICMWKAYWEIPYSNVLFSICILLLLYGSSWIGVGCDLSHPWEAALGTWLCGMLVWPRVRESWHRGEKTKYDYDQYSCCRPAIFTLPFERFLIVLHSPSLFALLAAALVVALFLPEGVAGYVTATLGSFLLAVFCCARLPSDNTLTRKDWENQDKSYFYKIDTSLKIIKNFLSTRGIPRDGDHWFDSLSIQVPLLLQEAEILKRESITLSERGAQELKILTTDRVVEEFCDMLDDYGPYTKECCIS